MFESNKDLDIFRPSYSITNGGFSNIIERKKPVKLKNMNYLCKHPKLKKYTVWKWFMET